MEASSPVTPQVGESLQERLRKSHAEKKRKEPVRVAIPGCDAMWETDDGKKHAGCLVARYKVLNYEAARDIGWQNTDDDALAELSAAADTLVKACDGVEAVEDGNATDLGVTMGLSLAQYLGADLDGIDTDTQAVFLVFPDDLKLMSHYVEVAKRMGLIDEKALQDLLGNSEAASS